MTTNGYTPHATIEGLTESVEAIIASFAEGGWELVRNRLHELCQTHNQPLALDRCDCVDGVVSVTITHDFATAYQGEIQVSA